MTDHNQIIDYEEQPQLVHQVLDLMNGQHASAVMAVLESAIVHILVRQSVTAEQACEGAAMVHSDISMAIEKYYTASRA